MKKSADKKPKTLASKNLKVKTSEFSNKTIRRLADSPLPEIAFLASFILSRWWLNSDFSYPSEMLLPLVLFTVLATVIFYAYRFILGKGFAAHVSGLLLSYLLYSYSFIQNSKLSSSLLNIIPSGLRTDFIKSIFLPIVLAILCGLVAWLLNKVVLKYKTLQNLQLYKVVLFAIAFAFSIQFVRFTQRYIDIHTGLTYQYPAASFAKPSTNPQSYPDIYYFVFDRYTNSEVLNQSFNYDNTDLLNFLNSKNFVTRDEAYSNYPFTMSSVSSTMSMSYLTELKDKFDKEGQWQPTFPYRSILKDPPIAQVLKQNGYKYNQLSSWWDFTRLDIEADSNPTQSYRLSVANKSFYLSDLNRDILNKSVFSPWLKKGVVVGSARILKYDLDRNPKENFESQMDALKNIYGRADKVQPNFTFSHILAPHPPYVFDANGNPPNYDSEANDNGVDEHVKYTSELTYVNKRLKEIITNIQKTSPNAVIILQADEGPYPKEFRGDITASHYYDPAQLPLPLMKQKFGILASYYMPSANTEDVKQINASVDTFRFVLNNYLGYSLPMLPDCNFAMGNKFSIYNYNLVSDKLKGTTPPPECKGFE